MTLSMKTIKLEEKRRLSLARRVVVTEMEKPTTISSSGYESNNIFRRATLSRVKKKFSSAWFLGAEKCFEI